MQRHLLPVISVVLTLAMVLTAVLDPRVLAAPPSEPVLALLLVLPVLVAAVLVAAGRGRPLARTAWWRALVLGYATIIAGDLLAALAAREHGGPFATAASVLAMLGVGALAVAVVLWERTHGQSNPLDRALDAAMLALSLVTCVWVLVARPRLPHGHGPVLVLDLLSAAAAVAAVATVLVAMTAGTLRVVPAVWAVIAGVAQAAGDLWDYPAPFGGPHSLGAQWSWLLASAYFAALAQELVREGPAPTRPGPVRWRPVLNGIVCAGPLGLYVVQALDGDGRVPDARVLGISLLVLCLGCMVRVERAVSQAADLTTRLEGMARADHLTGLANRRTAEAELSRAMDRGGRGADALSVAVLDLDRFKDFNDRFGHHAGDELLVGAARAWSSCLGAGQILARLGGEEFLVVAPALAPGGLAEVVDRMRELTPRAQSFSAGIASWDGGEDGAALVARADGALYEAKATGRGRTCVAYSADVVGAS